MSTGDSCFNCHKRGTVVVTPHGDKFCSTECEKEYKGEKVKKVVDHVKFTAEVTITCPFCFGKVMANSKLRNGEVGVMHVVPPCDEFLAAGEDALDFLAKCRKKMTEN